LAGRGFGKTRTGAEWVREQVKTGKCSRLALVAQDAGDARDVMVEGESGILAISPPNNRPKYEPSKRRLTWPNGAMATLYAADDPDALRGPQHDGAWLDELAKWKYAQEAWDNLMMGLRLGTNPQAVITTTPRPMSIIKQLMKRAHPQEGDGTVVLTKGSTYENLGNLSPAFRQIIERYEGTRLGRQELEAEVLEDVEGALWTLAQIDKLRVTQAPDLSRIVVAIDPAVTSTAESDETGIVVAGKGIDKHYYVLADESMGRVAPAVWAARAVNAYHDHKANVIVAEANNGGDMIRDLIRTVDPKVPVIKVHASRGKLTRAEPISMLYEQGRVHHAGTFPHLEDQMCNYVPGDGDSPDRMDSLVWALTQLQGGFGGA
jgi:predicted phage terminase large subunit-like protein